MKSSQVGRTRLRLAILLNQHFAPWVCDPRDLQRGAGECAWVGILRLGAQRVDVRCWDTMGDCVRYKIRSEYMHSSNAQHVFADRPSVSK